MRISIGTRFDELGEHNGYGYATGRIIESLTRLGHEVNPNDGGAEVEIWFDQPQFWKWSSDSVYRVGYHPWESTQLLPKGKMSHHTSWLHIMNDVDEIWTPSPLVADWYARFMHIQVPIHVYEHGVDPVWSPVERKVDGIFKYLHVGAEAARKGSKEVMTAFRTAFGTDRGKTVELNMKMMSEGWSIIALPGINYLNEYYELDELIDLYHNNHVFVYPSWGEGFGLNPLQALATGMPTIIPGAWAPYQRYLHPKLNIPSRMYRSPWPILHPGRMLKPDEDALLEAMRYAYENYDELAAWHLAQVPALTADYSWDRLTDEAFKKLENRLEKSPKSLAR